MTKEIKWENLTPTEAETLAALVNSGKEVFAAPIEIEHKEQLETLGISWSQCRTWHIGSEPVIVHLTPADKTTYKFLINELRSRHRDEYRVKRCMIPGTHKPLIRCPDCNSCRKCPYPEYRDKHKANQISYEKMLELGDEAGGNTTLIEQLDAKLQYEEIREMMDKENPLITQVFEMKERDGLSNEEIATELGITKRQTYYLYSKALAIGKKYNRS